MTYDNGNVIDVQPAPAPQQPARKGNVLVLGNSGVGKSTLINAVIGDDIAKTSFGTRGTTEELPVPRHRLHRIRAFADQEPASDPRRTQMVTVECARRQ